MIGMERSSSDEQQESSPYSWWWDSHNLPPQSQRLHSALQDLDKKIKMILELTEDNGDTFAERANMYYQKRPQLIKLVQELYISYRSLADKYDHHLKSESSVKAPNPGSASNSSISSLKKVYPLQECSGKPNPHCTTSSEEDPSSRSESEQHLATGSGHDSGKKIVNIGDRDICSSSDNDLVISSSSCVEKEAGNNVVETKFSQLLEENLSQQTELIRRNDEKREMIVELRNEIKILKSYQRKQKRGLMRGFFCMP
ncbi:uncharacterized protein [Primulina huaijiensis]|uniref:uncharacterized protein n=1 Tax=Primulina huaijiensis TaxID=1492673 RepID=UPI003CC74A34